MYIFPKYYFFEDKHVNAFLFYHTNSKDFFQKSLISRMIKNINLRNIYFKHYQIIIFNNVNNNFKNLV